MKAVLLFCCFVVAVYSETCSRTKKCTETTCHDSNHHVVCALGHCTCSGGANGHTCTDQGDCRDEHCSFRFDRVHCVDGHCHCTLSGISTGK